MIKLKINCSQNETGASVGTTGQGVLKLKVTKYIEHIITWGYKTVFMLNSTEHGIHHAHNVKMPKIH